MLKLLVIADDFTGALDTGVQFSKRGIATLVTTGDEVDFAGLGPETEVLVADIQSRHLAPDQARASVARLVRAAVGHGVPYFYKKTDSTLRGNIGAELAALLEECGRKCLSFVPAFPKNRRTTKNGLHYVDGVKLAETVFARDPFEPVVHSSVEEIIHRQTGLKTRCVPQSGYDRARIEPEERLIRIFDAETEADLRSIGRVLKESDGLYALAGCAGFAEFLPELLELRFGEVKWRNEAGPMLIVTGSVNQVTIDQIGRAAGRGFRLATLDPRQKLDRAYPESEEGGEFVREVAGLLAEHGKVILNSINDRSQIRPAERYARENGIQPDEIRGLIADNIGRITARLLRRTKVGSLVVFGGDTLASVLGRLGCGGIAPILEISPGVVAARMTSQAGGLNLITKSGGLGAEDVVESIEKFVFSGNV